jgi:hypothetical protein
MTTHGGDIQLPRVPVVVTVNVEVESHDMALAEGAGLFGRYSYGRYGAREGVWRLLNVFATEGIKATFFVDADDAERHSHLVEAIMGGGHEVAQLGPIDISDENDPAVLRRRLVETRDRLAAVTGCEIKGWRAAQGVMSEQTLPQLAQIGLLYESSFQDDDHPYIFGENGSRLVELPSFRYLTDTIFFNARQTDATVATAWSEEFAAMHAEGSYVMLTVNTRGDFGCGRAPRAAMVGDWISRVRRAPDIGFLRCDSLAAAIVDSASPQEPFPTLVEFAQDAAPAA